MPLSSVVGPIAQERSATYQAFRHGLGPDADRLPDSFAAVEDAVVRFADLLTATGRPLGTWDPDGRSWLP